MGFCVYLLIMAAVRDMFDKQVQIAKSGVVKAQQDAARLQAIADREAQLTRREFELRQRELALQQQAADHQRPVQAIAIHSLSSGEAELTAQEQECRSWINSNLIEPSPDKRKFIREHCLQSP